MLSGYTDMRLYGIEEEDSDEGGDTKSLPSYLLPIAQSPQYMQFLYSDIDDCFLMIEFSEIEGPVPVYVLPENRHPGFDIHSFAVSAMCVDHAQVQKSFSLIGDRTSFFTKREDKTFAMLHHVALYDIHARGFVRPFCFAYVTPHKRKVLLKWDSLCKELKKASELLKFSCLLKFERDLSHELNGVNGAQNRSCSSPERLDSLESEIRHAHEVVTEYLDSHHSILLQLRHCWALINSHKLSSVIDFNQQELADVSELLFESVTRSSHEEHVLQRTNRHPTDQPEMPLSRLCHVGLELVYQQLGRLLQVHRGDYTYTHVKQMEHKLAASGCPLFIGSSFVTSFPSIKPSSARDPSKADRWSSLETLNSYQSAYSQSIDAHTIDTAHTVNSLDAQTCNSVDDQSVTSTELLDSFSSLNGTPSSYNTTYSALTTTHYTSHKTTQNTTHNTTQHNTTHRNYLPYHPVQNFTFNTPNITPNITPNVTLDTTLNSSCQSELLDSDQAMSSSEYTDHPGSAGCVYPLTPGLGLSSALSRFPALLIALRSVLHAQPVILTSSVQSVHAAAVHQLRSYLNGLAACMPYTSPRHLRCLIISRRVRLSDVCRYRLLGVVRTNSQQNLIPIAVQELSTVVDLDKEEIVYSPLQLGKKRLPVDDVTDSGENGPKFTSFLHHLGTELLHDYTRLSKAMFSCEESVRKLSDSELQASPSRHDRRMSDSVLNFPQPKSPRPSHRSGSLLSQVLLNMVLNHHLGQTDRLELQVPNGSSRIHLPLTSNVS